MAPRTWGPARVAGVVGLAVVALLGLSAGWNGAIELACLYVGADRAVRGVPAPFVARPDAPRCRRRSARCVARRPGRRHVRRGAAVRGPGRGADRAAVRREPPAPSVTLHPEPRGPDGRAAPTGAGAVGRRRRRGRCAAADRAGHRRAAAGQGPRAEDRLRPRPVRPGVEGRGPQRLRHPQRHPAPGPHRTRCSRTGRTAAWWRRAPCTTRTRAKPIAFVRGQDTSSAVQIDHVVALSDSWQKGAQQWDTAEAGGVRQRPAEPARGRRSAEPAEGRRRHGDVAAAEQGVPVRVRRPAGRREVHVRAVGHAGRAGRDGRRAVDVPDGAVAGRLGGPAAAGRRGPGGRRRAARRRATRRPRARPGRPAAPVAPVAPAPAPVTGPFANCTEAWAAGAAPVHVGDPGYAPKLDRDSDGIGCEKRP